MSTGMKTVLIIFLAAAALAITVFAVTNRRGVGHGVESMKMDGVLLADNRLPVRPGRHCVEVVL